MSAAPVLTPGLPTRRDVWRRRAIIANLVAQIGIVVTGGAVRLTASGLGCSTWPMCEPGAFTPVRHAAATGHSFIEFGNRTLTGVLGVIAVAVAVLVWTNRSRGLGYRRLGLAPLIGVALQAVVGGITVLLHLHPAVVAVHMLISLGLIAASTLLLRREGEGDDAPRALVGPAVLRVGWVLAGVAVVLLCLGVVVTGAGPHGGDDEVATAAPSTPRSCRACTRRRCGCSARCSPSCWPHCGAPARRGRRVARGSCSAPSPSPRA